MQVERVSRRPLCKTCWTARLSIWNKSCSVSQYKPLNSSTVVARNCLAVSLVRATGRDGEARFRHCHFQWWTQQTFHVQLLRLASRR